MAPQTHEPRLPELATLAGLDPGLASRDRGIDVSSSAVETLDPAATAASSRVDPAWPRVGRFELRGRLGTGAMGVVYEAHDPSLDRALRMTHARTGGRAVQGR